MEVFKPAKANTAILLTGLALAGCGSEEKITDPTSGIVIKKYRDHGKRMLTIASCRSDGGNKAIADEEYLKKASQDISTRYSNVINKDHPPTAEDGFESLEKHPVTAEGSVENLHAIKGRLGCSASLSVKEQLFKLEMGSYIDLSEK